MADKQNPNDPQYDWLYTGQQRPPQQPPADDATQQASQPPEDDATQQIQRQPSSDQGRPPGQDRGPEPTQILGAQPPPQQGGQPGSQSPQQQSFGGTYDAPRRGPRFATPASPGQPPPAQGGYRPPPRRKRRNWWVRGIVGLLVLWLVFLIAVPIYAWTKVSEVDAEPGGDRPDDTSGTTYLLVGSDSREELTKQERGELGTGKAGGNRTDTILLLHVTDGDGPNALVSIPRDSFVEIPGNGENKINAAYSIGGPDLLVDTVEQNTNLHVDNYIEIGFGGFVDIVDGVGGIEICPKKAVKDRKAKLKVEAGCQEADGQTALGYSRSRKFAKGDITRARHQREVIAGIGSAAASWQTFVFPWRYWNTNMAGAESLRVGENVGPYDLARFAWAMSKSGGDDTKRCVIPYSDLGASTSAGSAVTWDEARSEALFEALRDDDTSKLKCKAE